MQTIELPNINLKKIKDIHDISIEKQLIDCDAVDLINKNKIQYETFLSFIKNDKIIIIYGKESSGKSTLLKLLLCDENKNCKILEGKNILDLIKKYKGDYINYIKLYINNKDTLWLLKCDTLDENIIFVLNYFGEYKFIIFTEKMIFEVKNKKILCQRCKSDYYDEKGICSICEHFNRKCVLDDFDNEMLRKVNEKYVEVLKKKCDIIYLPVKFTILM